MHAIHRTYMKKKQSVVRASKIPARRTPNPPPCDIKMGGTGDVKKTSLRTQDLKVKVRNKKLSASSKKWMNRQLNDPFVHQARMDGYRSRAAYKILEVHEKYKIFRPHMTIVDLGAAPGGWCQVAARILNHTGVIYAVDLLEMDPIPGVDFVHGDFNELIPHLPESVDVVMSDMAPSACGIRSVDHVRIMGMLEEVVHLSVQLLSEGGTLVAKVLNGGAEKDLLLYLKKHFTHVHHMKPKSSRAESKEFFVVALGFKKLDFQKPKSQDNRVEAPSVSVSE